MLRTQISRLVGAFSRISAGSAEDDRESNGGKDPSNPHVVRVRETDSYVDVRSMDSVTWDEEERMYQVEQKVPMMKQAAIDSDPMVRSKLNVERRADGMYLTQHTEHAETAHAISRFMSLLWENNE